MPDWLASFHLPKFTDEKFEKQKEAYNKKFGYTVTVPAFGDVIQLKRFPPLTEKETKLWTGKIPVSEMPRHDLTVEEIDTWIRTKKGSPPRTRTLNAEEQKEYRANAKNLIPAERLAEIKTEKENKRRKYLAMLGSPSPKIVRSAGAVLTSLDDAQDAISTLACIGKIAAVVAGGTTAAVLSGPVGWLAAAATMLQMINPYSKLKRSKTAPKMVELQWIKGKSGKYIVGRKGKKDAESATDKNPFSKKARAKTAANIKKFKPSLANAIEALQVTSGIFGVGVSIGPLMGFAQDVAAGLWRAAKGEKVSWKSEPPPITGSAASAMKALKAQAVFHGFPWKSDMTDEIASMMASNLALQVVEPYLKEWNPLEQVENLANVEISAPRPTDVLTLEIIEESGKSLDDVCNWPQNGEQWISLGELQDKTAQQAAENLTRFAQDNPNSIEAFIAGQNAHDFALGVIEAIEGPGHVSIEYSITERIILIILDNGWEYPKDITEAQVEKFEDWIYTHEYMNTPTSAKDIWRYAEVFCGFSWARSPDEYR